MEFKKNSKRNMLILLLVTIIVLLIIVGISFIAGGDKIFFKLESETKQNKTAGQTLANITNDNIGDYIDLQNDPLGTGNTATNWRIFYKEENTVYVILADYLPNSTNYASNAGLNEKKMYGVGTNSYLCEKLTETSNWSELANGYSTNVTGAPTYEQLKTSWNNNSQMMSKLTDNESEQKGLIDSTGLYIPHTSVVNDCVGYWLATYSNNYAGDPMVVRWCGDVWTSHAWESGFGLRPVVSLSSNISANYTENTWTLSK